MLLLLLLLLSAARTLVGRTMATTCGFYRFTETRNDTCESECPFVGRRTHCFQERERESEDIMEHGHGQTVVNQSSEAILQNRN